jgi:ketosteroid isomerase-like protein
MKNKIVTGVFSGCMLSLIISCNQQPAAPVVDKDQIKKDIQAKENEFADLYNKGEVKDIGYYADDATTFFPNRPPLVGKDSIVSFLKNDLISNTDKLSFNTNEVFVSNDGNQVLEVGYFKLVDSSNAVINT